MAEEDGPAAALELLSLGSLLGLALVRVPAADHRSLGGACRTLRRIVLGDDFARLRETVGAAEHGLLMMFGELGDKRLCLTHNQPTLGLAPPELVPPPLHAGHLGLPLFDAVDHSGGLAGVGWCEVGTRSFVMERHSGQLKIYDSATRSWSLGSPLTAIESTREQILTTVSYNECIYVFACKRPLAFSQRRLQHLDEEHSVYVYDIGDDVWIENTPLPVCPSRLVACVHEGHLTVLGLTPNEDRITPDDLIIYRMKQLAPFFLSNGGTGSTWGWSGGRFRWSGGRFSRSAKFPPFKALVSFPLRLRAAR